jgi:cellulose synthase/poly-beta-1,6-N-acetylglucosamine synthase-like glycosyltransferase
VTSVEPRPTRRSNENHHFGGKIAGEIADVLPRMDADLIADALRRLPPDEFDLALRDKLVPLVALPGLVLNVACSPASAGIARRAGRQVVAEAPVEDFHEALRRTHGAHLIDRATYGLARAAPILSANRRFTLVQALFAVILLAAIGATAMVMPVRLAWLLASLAAGLFFLGAIGLRALCLLPSLRTKRAHARSLSNAELPVYSVLVPLFREQAVLGQLLAALAQLDYPRARLDIKLLLEETDIEMRRAVSAIELPSYFEVIVVPAGRPQTKPRALTYGLRFARGELVTIFDAEDIPEPDQLRLAAETFAALPPDVACLQAKIAFYNPDENWLTRQFTVEYATIFGLLLPTLGNHHLPLPLGGTSNHFRIEVLRAVGGWDPFNVTEDADLGFRLARAGYVTGTLDSLTYEEASLGIGNWLRQRARWLKGFLVTWLVHMRQPLELMRDLGPAGFWALQALTIGAFGSALVHPFCMAASVVILAYYPPNDSSASLVTLGLAGLNLAVLVAGYGVSIVAGRMGLRQLGFTGWLVPLITMPVYWMLISVAAWLALWQFITAHSYWNKTSHGLSRLQSKRSPS